MNEKPDGPKRRKIYTIIDDLNQLQNKINANPKLEEVEKHGLTDDVKAIKHQIQKL